MPKTESKSKRFFRYRFLMSPREHTQKSFEEQASEVIRAAMRDRFSWGWGFRYPSALGKMSVLALHKYMFRWDDKKVQEGLLDPNTLAPHRSRVGTKLRGALVGTKPKIRRAVGLKAARR